MVVHRAAAVMLHDIQQRAVYRRVPQHHRSTVIASAALTAAGTSERLVRQIMQTAVVHQTIRGRSSTAASMHRRKFIVTCSRDGRDRSGSYAVAAISSRFISVIVTVDSDSYGNGICRRTSMPKRLVDLIWINWVRCRLTFCLGRTSIALQCLPVFRLSIGRQISPTGGDVYLPQLQQRLVVDVV